MPGMPAAGMYQMGGAPVPGGERASMGMRLLGLIVDDLVLGVPLITIGIVTGGIYTTGSTTSSSASFAVHLTPWFTVVNIVVGLGYYGYFVGMKGRTLGHMAAGLRVVDVNTGGLIGPGKAILRDVVLTLSRLLCGLGLVSPFFDSQRRQGWHDKATSAVVIPA
ncbi:MAG: RDD family protein [Frankiaceae bacterium]|jgi:uncharacterized RDD family membrane protein YckC|nr:RDD family protein [Frankiaceae bacterium]